VQLCRTEKEMTKDAAEQPLLKTGKAGSALLNVKGLPPFVAIRELFLRFFNSPAA